MNLLTELEFGRLFHAFEHTAFRLETRDRYNAPYENESLRKFLAGEQDDFVWFQDWLAMIRAAAAKGKRFRRVRVVTIPLNDYGRFGLYCAQHTNAAGEDIRYLERGQPESEGLPGYVYWLFDSRQVVRMHFDDADIFVGAESSRTPP